MVILVCCALAVVAVCVMCLFLLVLWLSLWSVIVAFPGHTHFLQSSRGGKLSGYFTLVLFQLSCGGLCSMSLPRCDVCWSMDCDCGIYGSQ